VHPGDVDGERAAQLASSLGVVRARLAAACEAVGRDPREVTLIAVTKTYPAADVATLVRLGVLDIGESKEQEAQRKRAELADAATAVRWHMVGRIQSNKARTIGAFARAVHSVDRLKLVDRLAEGARQQPAPVEVFVQVSLDDDPGRGGAVVGDVAAIADAVAARPELRLRGLMAVPPLGTEPAAAFARLQELGTRLQAEHPAASALSAGMSSDLDAAVAHGSTHVRVGTALLGRRTSIVS